MADNFLDGAREFVRDQFCNVTTAGAGFFGYAATAAENFGVPGAITTVPADAINGAVGLFCNRIPDPIPPEIPPAFTGGQCVGDRYRITASWTRNFPDGNSTEIIDRTAGQLYRGPIEEVFIINGNDDVRVRHDFGTESDFLSGNPSTFTVSNLRDISVENVDNPADDCGDLPGTRPTQPTPGVDSPINDDIVVDDGTGPINIPVDISFGDLDVSVSGNLNIGFNIVNPDFSLFGDIDLTTGDISFNFGGRKPDNEKCCLPPDIDDNDQPEEGEEDPPETQQVIVGVLVNSVVDTAAINSTLVTQVNGPDFYNPRVGNIYFLLRVEGQIFWTEPIKIQHENQYVQCPVDFGAIRVVANPIPGVTMRLSPIRRRIPIDEFPT